MCEPTTIAYGVAAMVGGYAAASAMAPDIPTPQATAPTAPPGKAAQGAKQPEVKPMKAANGAGSGINAGPASTFLTGPTGVDPSTLTLGKNTLLGQ